MKRSVLKVLCLTLVLFITATNFLTEVALSIPLSARLLVTAQSPVTSPSLKETPSLKTAAPQASESSTSKGKVENSTEQPRDRKTVDSERVKSTPDKTPSPSAGPYDMERIKQFNRALYGS